ncbi:MAG: Pycsar system effector family protein [Cyclobacteriaceae bacterium]
MVSEKSECVLLAENWVKNYFSTKDAETYTYHNLEHTLHVEKASGLLADAMKLSSENTEIVLLAALFHDTGCWDHELKNHELRSQAHARNFLEKNGAAEATILEVEACILATRIPQQPQNVLHRILCDADLSHFSQNDFLAKSMALRKEMENLGMPKKKELDWIKETLELVKAHEYHTEEAKTAYNTGKLKTILDLENKLVELKKNTTLKLSKKEWKIYKKTLPERGVETMFRTTSKNHLQLSAIADNKANIMISVNAIIVSIIITVLVRNLNQQIQFIFPTILLLATNLATIVFAVLATRPKVSDGYVTERNIQEKTSNLLYFGNFHRMELQDYESGMKKMMEDSDFLYSTMIKDIYFLGKVLHKKYALLQKSYNVFMYGLIISAIAFLLALAF